MRVYLDNAATTPLAPEVLEAMMPYFKEHFGNPSAQHSYGRESRAAVEQARKVIAGCLQAKTSEIIFTSGGTESNNLALVCSVRDLGVERIISSPTEHHCVLHTIEWLADHYQIKVENINLKHDGSIDIDHLESLLQESNVKTLVSVMHGNNEIGVLCDLKEVGTLCEKYTALFHSDTVQTMAHFPFDVEQLKVHFLTGSAHKFHGPKGIGFLYAKKGLSIKPIIHGGGQERNKRAGTENLYGIVGMAKAMQLACEHLEDDKAHILELKRYLFQQLSNGFEDIRINGPEDFDNSLYTVLNISFPPDPRGSLLLFNLDMEGLCVSGGSACTSGASSGSHVINAISQEQDRVSIRFSFSKYNTKAELDFAIEKIFKVFNVKVEC